MADEIDLAAELERQIRAGERKVPSIVVGFPWYHNYEGPTTHSLFKIACRVGRTCHILPLDFSGGYIEWNRNAIVRSALAVEQAMGMGDVIDYLFWVDSDMQMPDSTLLRLIAHDKDIVGPNYRVRTPPFGHAGCYMDGTDRDVMARGLVPMQHLPTGLMLCKFDIFRKLPGPWFVAPTEEGQPRDDVYFCRKARAAGYEVWCDQELTREVYHRGVQDIGWFPDGAVQQQVVDGTGLNIQRHEDEAREQAEKLGAEARIKTPEIGTGTFRQHDKDMLSAAE